MLSASVFDPAERLARLLEDRPEGRDEFWSAQVAEAARAAGDVERELWALRRQRVPGEDRPADLAFAERVLETGSHVREGLRAARQSVELRGDPKGVDGTALDPGLRWRRRLAEAYEVEGRLELALGHGRRGREALLRAIALVPLEPEDRIRAGLASEGRSALELLASGLAELDDAEARARLAEVAEELDLWAPDLDALIAAYRAPTEAPPEASLDGSAFDGLTAMFGGEERPLLGFDGPVVVDVWATWCGPCQLSLPHLNELAQRYAGKATFVALSVDQEADASAHYVAKHGEPAFTMAWNADALSKVAPGGIPAMFVFDAEHRLVARIGGYSPGSRELDDAVEEVVR